MSRSYCFCSENTRCLLESIFAMSSPGLLAADTSKLQLPSTTSAIGTWTFSMIRKTLGSSDSVLKQGGSQQSVDSLDIDNDEEGHEAGLETDWYVASNLQGPLMQGFYGYKVNFAGTYGN